MTPLAKQKVEMKKILALIDKALMSTSVKDKNDQISELMTLWMRQDSLFEKCRATTSVVNSELVVLKARLDAAVNSAETLRRNTSFFARADAIRRRRSFDSFVDSIKDSEAQIIAHHPLHKPGLLAQFCEQPEGDRRLFNIIDLNLLRLEQLAAVFKKRLYAVEQSQGATEDVVRDFGSLNNVVDFVELAGDENVGLKGSELGFMPIPVSRRRRLGQMAPCALRAFAQVNRRMLSLELGALAQWKQSSHVEGQESEEKEIDIDGFLSDPSFSAAVDSFEAGEFGNTTEPEALTPLLDSSSSIADKIKAYQYVLKKAEMSGKKIQTENLSLVHRTFSMDSAALTTVDKLIDANEDLFGRVLAENADLNRLYEEIGKMAKLVENAAYERSLYMFSVHKILDQLRALAVSHEELTVNESNNVHIVCVLFHFIAEVGQMLLKGDENENATCEFIRQRCQVASLERMALDAIATTRAQLELEREENKGHDMQEQSPMSLRMRIKSLKKRKRSKSDRGKSIDEEARVPPEEEYDVKAEKIPDLIGAHHVEIVHLLAAASELAGFVFGRDYNYRQRLDEFSRPWLSSARTDIKNGFDGLGSEFRHLFPVIMTGGKKFLVKEKESIITQTMSVEFADAGTEPDEALSSSKVTTKARKK
jgi:hypothetical protein